MTVSAVAENKNIIIEGIDVHVSRSAIDGHGDKVIFTVETALLGNLTKRERILLFNSARKCEVGKLLQGDVELDHVLLET